MKKKWLRILFMVLSLATFGYLGHKYYGKLGLLLHPDPGWIAAMVVVYLVGRVFNAEVMRLTLRRLGQTILRTEAFALTMVMSYANLLIPNAGLGAPALYLKYKYQVKYATFSAMLVPLVVLQLTCASALGLAGSAWLGATGGWARQYPLMGFFALVVAGGLVAVFVPLPIPKRLSLKLATAVRRFNRSRLLLVASKGLLAKTIFLHVLSVLFRAARLELAFRALGVGGHLPEVLVASVAAQFMLLISLAPGALGFREAAAVAVYAYLMGDPEAAFGATLLDRILVSVVIVVSAQIALWLVVRPVLSGPGRTGDGKIPESDG